jgi:Methyltransferase domain
MGLKEYFENIPLLHTWDGGRTWNTGGFDRRALEIITAVIDRNFPSPRILETGCGNSTISFLLCDPVEVVAICPDKELFDRIMDYCSRQSISTAALRPIVGCSEWELPRIAQQSAASGTHFDVALIDGSHNWPVVFVDFCYVHAVTREGSLILVDDIQLHTARELANLLMEQPGFALEEELGKTLIFRKTSNSTSMPEWNHQPYVVRRSTPQTEPWLRRKLRRAVYRFPYAPAMIKAVKRII